MMGTEATTISKVIAFELGLLIAVLTWLAVAGIPGFKPRAVAEAEEPADSSFGNVSPIYQPTQPRHHAPVNYRADDLQPAQSDRAPANNLQVAQTGAQNPRATVQTYDPGLTNGGYDDTVDGSGQLSYAYDQPGVEGYIVNQDPANSVGIFPEPVLDSPNCYYLPYGYSQPVRIVVLTTNRGFASRNRMPHRSPWQGMRNAPRRNPRAAPPLQEGRPPGNVGLAPRRNAPVQMARPSQLSQARWNP